MRGGKLPIFCEMIFFLEKGQKLEEAGVLLRREKNDKLGVIEFVRMGS